MAEWKKNGIIPNLPVFYDARNQELVSRDAYWKVSDELDLEAICVFAACGFFLNEDTHFKHIKALPPATEYEVEGNRILQKRTYFQWHYQPRNITLSEAVEEFKVLFERITDDLTKNRKVILPLSGGLDSRSLAAAVKKHPSVYTYSYEFKDGVPETWFSKKIAEAENYTFDAYAISEPYLWKGINRLAKTLLCQSEFTHPRQFSVIDEVSKRGDVFLLGHWGDVLFDGMGVPDSMSFDEQVQVLYKKVLKKGGKELGKELWNVWRLPGDFESYLKGRLSPLLEAIKIENANSRVRAFKSMYWAPRWTSSNLAIFDEQHPMAIPYYHDEMCQFICGIPESLLADRQIQIEYLKKYHPELAAIPRQGYAGLNLFQQHRYGHWSSLPHRILDKLKRVLIKPIKTQRNWEIQFLGTENEKELHRHLYENKPFTDWIPSSLVKKAEQQFHQDGIQYSHPLSILLTLSCFARLRNPS